MLNYIDVDCDVEFIFWSLAVVVAFAVPVVNALALNEQEIDSAHKQSNFGSHA